MKTDRRKWGGHQCSLHICVLLEPLCTPWTFTLNWHTWGTDKVFTRLHLSAKLDVSVFFLSDNGGSTKFSSNMNPKPFLLFSPMAKVEVHYPVFYQGLRERECHLWQKGTEIEKQPGFYSSMMPSLPVIHSPLEPGKRSAPIVDLVYVLSRQLHS